MNFNKYQFSDIIELISEKIKIKELSESEYISTDNILPNLGGVISAESLPNANSCNKFLKNDVLFSNIRTYFKKVWLAEFSGGCSPDVLIMRSKDENILLNEYLFLLISSDDFINFTVASSKGTKMPRGDKNAMKTYIFEIPDIEYQKECIKNYFSFNKKIQLNTQINQTLEQIAQAIFKSWFVDFDPVQAKADALADGLTPAQAERAAMRVISGKNTAELDRLQTENPDQYHQLQQLAAAFPSEFEEIEGFGKVPKGWGVRKIGDIGKFVKGKKPKEVFKIQEIDMLPHILTANLSGKYGEFANPENLIISQMNETIISMDGTAGKVSIGHNGIIGSTLAKMIISDNRYYAIFYCTLKNNEKDIQENTTGTSVPHTDKTRVLNYPIIIPCDFILDNFTCFFGNQLNLILKNRKESQTLESLRDLLLPRLLSGEVWV